LAIIDKVYYAYGTILSTISKNVMDLMVSKIKHFFTKMQDILITDICYLLPCVCKWFYHRIIKKDIFHYQLQDSLSGKKASLYKHGKGELKEESQAVLILHGLYSHPCMMLHLAKIAQNANPGPVFSLFVLYEDNLDKHRSLINQAMDCIEKKCLHQGFPFKGIILIGHSMGAIEAAYSAYVENDNRISSVISIAGRLKVVKSAHSPCQESLKESLNKIYKIVQSNHPTPLYQIAGRYDWCAPLESTLIRKIDGCYHIVEDGMHFNVLFHKDIYRKLPEFLEKSLSQR
jgi:predicted esterase